MVSRPRRRALLSVGVAVAGILALTACSSGSGSSTDSSIEAPASGAVSTAEGDLLPEPSAEASASLAAIPDSIPEYADGTLTTSSVSDDGGIIDIEWTTTESAADAAEAYGLQLEKAGYVASDVYSDPAMGAGGFYTGDEYIVSVQAYSSDGVTYVSAHGEKS